MTEYILLIPADEAAWETSTAEDKQRMYEKHREFGELLAERGHKMINGAELKPSNTAWIVASDAGEVSVTAGPYAEAVEQLSGFYLIESDDRDDLIQCIGRLADAEGRLELREVNRS
jgi:hypothetical protein